MSDNLFFVLLFTGLGFLVAAPFSGWFWYTGRKAQKLAAESKSWPTTQAKVLESTVQEVVRRGSKGARNVTHRPVVRYEYSVAGTRYEGNVIQFGLTEVGTRKSAEVFIKDRAMGAMVPVSYNNADPKMATLDTSSKAADWRVVTAWIVLFILPAFLALIAALVSQFA